MIGPQDAVPSALVTAMMATWMALGSSGGKTTFLVEAEPVITRSGDVVAIEVGGFRLRGKSCCRPVTVETKALVVLERVRARSDITLLSWGKSAWAATSMKKFGRRLPPLVTRQRLFCVEGDERVVGVWCPSDKRFEKYSSPGRR